MAAYGVKLVSASRQCVRQLELALSGQPSTSSASRQRNQITVLYLVPRPHAQYRSTAQIVTMVSSAIASKPRLTKDV